ncbi:MAG: alpha/beta fold hydrolase [Rhodocyclaceae bacterium]|nr:alpha/beta fold hydrolase [Rhodocyclaceae bacterium]
MLVYLHGFSSGPQSFKARALHAHMTRLGLADRFLCPQLPVSPAAAIALLARLLEAPLAAGTRVTLVGSSLGGFYATHLAEKFSLAAVLVNPVVLGSLDVRKWVGRHTWHYTGKPFEFTHAHVAELLALDVPQPTEPSRYWLLVETGDEVLDYRAAVARYAGARQTVLAGGDHSFTRWSAYLDEILAFAGFF